MTGPNLHSPQAEMSILMCSDKDRWWLSICYIGASRMFFVHWLSHSICLLTCWKISELPVTKYQFVVLGIQILLNIKEEASRKIEKKKTKKLTFFSLEFF